jgi:hypothetical protein
MKKFFDENPHLTTYEFAVLANKSPSTIRNWKRKCGLNLKESPFKVRVEYKRREVSKVANDHVWDNEDWLRQKYEHDGFGIPTIAKMIGHSVSLVASRLKKYDIATRQHIDAVKSSNKACNEEWLYTNYTTRDQYIEWCSKKSKMPTNGSGKALSLAKCAELADVVPYTIYNWLVRFKIPIRDISEAMAGENNPFYGKKHSDATKARIREAYWRSRKNDQNLSGEGGDQGSIKTS